MENSLRLASNVFGPGAMAALNGTRTHFTSSLGVSELVGDRVGDRGFEALAVGGVVVDEPRRVGRLIGAESDGPLGQGGQGVLACTVPPAREADDVLSAGSTRAAR